jgi:hypothetical protein
MAIYRVSDGIVEMYTAICAKHICSVKISRS